MTAVTPLALFAMFGTAFGVGRLFLAIFRTPAPLGDDPAITLLAGMVVTAFALCLFRLGTGLPMVWAALALAVATPIGLLATRQSRPQPIRRPNRDRSALAALVVALVAATFWTRHDFPILTPAGEDLIYWPGDEYFVHATYVWQMSSPVNPWTRGAFYLAGAPFTLYHYVSYVWPALLEILTHQPALQTVSSLWTPLGLAQLGLAAYGLGTCWFGRRAGFWCAVAAVAIPDASLWSLRVWLFSLDLLTVASPSLAYGIAAAGLGAGLATMGVSRRQAGPFFAGIVLAGTTALIKAQIFVSLLPLAAFFLVIGLIRLKSVLARGAIAIMIAATVAAGLAASTFKGAPSLSLDPNRGAPFLSDVLNTVPPDSFLQDFSGDLEKPASAGVLLSRTVLLILVCCQGLLFLAAPVAIVELLRFRRSRLPMFIVAIALVTFVAIGLLIGPNQNGDPFELQHRPFTWVYFLLTVWTTGSLRTWITKRDGPISLSVGVALALAPAAVAPGMINLRVVELPRDLVASAGFIRENADPAAMIQDSANDPLHIVLALAERRALVIRPDDLKGPAASTMIPIMEKNLEKHALLETAATTAALRDAVQLTGVRWYLAHPSAKLSWPKDLLAKPAFQSGRYRVYDLASLLAPR